MMLTLTRFYKKFLIIIICMYFKALSPNKKKWVLKKLSKTMGRKPMACSIDKKVE